MAIKVKRYTLPASSGVVSIPDHALLMRVDPGHVWALIDDSQTAIDYYFVIAETDDDWSVASSLSSIQFVGSYLVLLATKNVFRILPAP